MKKKVVQIFPFPPFLRFPDVLISVFCLQTVTVLLPVTVPQKQKAPSKKKKKGDLPAEHQHGAAAGCGINR